MMNFFLTFASFFDESNTNSLCICLIFVLRFSLMNTIKTSMNFKHSNFSSSTIFFVLYHSRSKKFKLFNNFSSITTKRFDKIIEFRFVMINSIFHRFFDTKFFLIFNQVCTSFITIMLCRRILCCNICVFQFSFSFVFEKKFLK